MRKWFLSLTVACGCTIALANSASAQVEIKVQAQAIQIQQIQIQGQPAQIQIELRADRVAMAAPSLMPANRLAQADVVFVGRVVALEPMDDEASQIPGGPKITYRIAVVQVTESIFGLKKDAQQVRIGFPMQPINGQPQIGGIQIQPAIQPLPPGGGGFGGRRPFLGNFQVPMQLTIGQDGLFTVNKHYKENFYLSPMQQNFVTREDNAAFEGQVKTAKLLGKVMADPVAALKADDKQDRYTAAAVLISKYRNAQNLTGKPMKQEPIDAAESKLILKALADGDFKQTGFNGSIPNPVELFNQLGVTVNDGYNPSAFRTQQDFATGVQKWLDENNGKYRIQKWVVDPNAKAQPGLVEPRPGVIRLGIQPLPPIRIQDLPANPAPNDK